MRWLKHMTDSHVDEKLAMLQAELGLEGYGFYWMALEVIAKQMDESDRTSATYPISFWRKKFGFSPKKLRKFVGFCADFEIFSAFFSENTLTLSCPNLLKYRDEWTKKKAKNSGATPESLQSKALDTDTEEERRERERAGEPKFAPPGDDLPEPKAQPKKTDCPSKGRPSRKEFMACWNIYPIKQGQEAAWREWCRLEDNGTLAPGWVIQDRIATLSAEDDRWLEGFVPSFAKFLHDKRWNDEPFKKPVRDGPAAPQGQLAPGGTFTPQTLREAEKMDRYMQASELGRLRQEFSHG